MSKNRFHNKSIKIAQVLPYGVILLGVISLFMSFFVIVQVARELLDIDERDQSTLLIDEAKIRQAIKLIDTQTVPD